VVLGNLLDNALRYAGRGATFRISAALAGDSVVLDVSDDGAGVDASDVPRLFERFFRSDRSRTTRGTGLGLAIVKHIVTAADGTAEVTGGPGEGTRFRFVLPAPRDALL
jgi:signal transduction histidine kinase